MLRGVALMLDVTLPQDEDLPEAANGSLRQQLHSWARHVAAVRAGSLQVAREFHSCREGMAISPNLDQVAAKITTLSPALFKVASLPATGAQVNVRQQLQAKRPGARTCSARRPSE